jgi:hypothetical protein
MKAELSAFLALRPLGSLPRLAIRTTEQLTGFFIADDLKNLRVIAQGPPRFHGEVRKKTTRREDKALFDDSDWTAMLCNDEKEFNIVIYLVATENNYSNKRKTVILRNIRLT